MEIFGKMIRQYRESVEIHFVNNNLPFYFNIFNNTNSSEKEILYAVCVFDDLLEFGSENVRFFYFIFIHNK